MIRTTLSFLALFGSLLVVSKALTETQAQEKKSPAASSSRRTTPQPTPAVAPSDKSASADNGALALARAEVKPTREPAMVSVAAAKELPMQELPAKELPGERLALVPSELLVSAPADATAGVAKADAAVDADPTPAAAIDAAAALSEDDEPAVPAPSGTTANANQPRVLITIQDETPARPARDAAPAELNGEPTAAGLPDEAEPSAEAIAAPEETPQRSFTPQQLELRDKIRDVLAYHIRRHESVERRSPWGIMHALIAYGVDTEVRAGDRNVNAIGWLCWNGVCRGQQLLYVDNGRLHAHQGPGVQGHDGQFLAMLAQSKVKIDFPIRAEGKSFTVRDLVEYEKRTCVEGTELTFKLIGLSHYLDLEEKWRADSGEAWDLPKLIKEELAQPVIGAACGGTHRMMGFSYSVKRREKAGLPMTGQWLRARKYVDSYHEYTFKLQNADGSFSTNWFRGPGEYGTIDRHLETTGHIAEWMVYSLSDEQLLDPRTFRAVNFLATMMHDNLDHEWEIGPKGHALHALALYDERVFGGQPGKRVVELAEHGKSRAAR